MKEINSLPIDASGQYLYVRVFNNGSVAVAVAGMACGPVGAVPVGIVIFSALKLRENMEQSMQQLH